jgi:hypothetical protein
LNVLGVCRISTRPCEGRGPSSTLGEGTERWRWSQTVRRLPAKQLQVGSTPTVASDHPTAWFGLHPLDDAKRLNLFPRWVVLIEIPTAGRDYIDNRRLGNDLVGTFCLEGNNTGDCGLGVHCCWFDSNRLHPACVNLWGRSSTVEQSLATTSSPVEYRPTAGSEYMLRKPGIVGSSPTGAICVAL